ncbi:carbohydrate ABC transporter permease [Candidatus Halobonum tyrrellensis]|uniref:Binding-protein-dependent transport systems inner membrane component n=1 Tax=Candidatus Halobonum tyrrellensis G22 TaxID=1324957 RepID=V4GXG5_9EURY|nr:carbohydrate ABC transporter permease [Candidatus Halobonum tyrrellensis]ESP89831.1 binding-protein-dependent transport systems inner membrane component [Candidatus Halobonum tyrrellensis G22]
MASENTTVRQASDDGPSKYLDTDRLFGEDTSLRKALLVYGGLFVYFLWFLVPVVWLALSTIKSGEIIQAQRLIIIPMGENFTLGHFEQVLTDPQFRQLFVNSTIIAFSTVALTLFLGILGAYSLSRFDYPGRSTLLVSFMATKMLPPALIIVPFFLMMYSYSLVDTYLGIILAHSIRALPLALWFLKGFFDDIPKALDESARIDGCSHFRVLYHIIIPLALPGIAVAGFYTFVTSWNDFLFVSVLSQGGGTRTLPYGLYMFQSQTSINWGATITAATITAVPSIVLFALVQNEIVEGLASGGMHGS